MIILKAKLILIILSIVIFGEKGLFHKFSPINYPKFHIVTKLNCGTLMNGESLEPLTF